MLLFAKNIMSLLFLFSFGLIGCQCDIVNETTYYKEGNPKTIITKKCDEILKYQHYTVDGELAFLLNYSKSEPQKKFEGRP